MMAPHAGLERRVLTALEATPPRIPVLIGGCGTGRTTALHALVDRLGRESCQYIDIERAASTPERFFAAVITASPFPRALAEVTSTSARDAFERTLAYFSEVRAAGRPVTFLLDEVLELRTFESFPGLRHVLRELLQSLMVSGNRFVLTSRYVARAHRLLRDGESRYEVIHLPALSSSEVNGMLPPTGEAAAGLSGRGGDPISALTALLTSDGTLTSWCGYRYELRLHRARGYGALKAILEILSQEEPLTLTEISQRLHRTPGSTKDYLSWLEDVDLITAHQKRYAFADPLLRLWVRLHGRPVPPTVDEVAREVQAYALARLPQAEPSLALAGSSGERTKPWGIIEID
jgi:hypothetical protein